MLTARRLKAMYRRQCKHDVVIRRYVGSGEGETYTDFPVKGNYRLYGASEIKGEIKQGDYRIVALAEDLAALGFALPLLTTDKTVVQDREREIVNHGDRRALDETLIAYEITARG